MLLFLELNEVNFEFIDHYVGRGLLPNFAAVQNAYGRTETVSEQRYEELEPWIQWVTAHTGLTFAEHKVFHLGDIVDTDLPQIWEALAARGLRVGAISPMNAKCRSDDLAFFVPDPWTGGEMIATPMIRRLHAAISQAVNDNAEARIAPASLMHLAIGAATIVPPGRYPTYVRMVAQARSRRWMKPIVLDRLLTDLFIKLVRRQRTDFASLFLNAAAHIQHHYMFSSAAYQGALRNPEGYVGAGMDPLLDVYAAYDAMLGDIISVFPQARIMLATGLHQDPHPTVNHYWRLRDHAAFLRRHRIDFTNVEPRMSRDFLVRFGSEAAASRAAAALRSAQASDGVPLFECDEQGNSLFVTLTYPHAIGAELTYVLNGRRHEGLHDDVVFVALKNGQHNGIGYFLDTKAPKPPVGASFPLTEMPARILEASDT